MILPTAPEPVESTLTTSQEPVLVSRKSPSRLEEIYRSQEFQRKWENNLPFFVAANILQLRKFRGWSQGKLARKAKTSQPAIARIENEDGNITLNTLERLIKALNGRLRFSIPPEEIASPKANDWWTARPPGGWEVRGVIVQDHGNNGRSAAVFLHQDPATKLVSNSTLTLGEYAQEEVAQKLT